MSKMKSVRIADHFAELTDPRRREVIYPLINVVVIAVCAVICGADDFVAIAKFGRTNVSGWRGFSTWRPAFRRTIASMRSWPPSNRRSSRSVC